MSVPNVSFSSLSPRRHSFVEFMRQLHYGRVEKLPIRGGEPILDQTPPQITREFKFPFQGTPRPEPDGDFLLKAQVIDLFRLFDRLGDATVTSLEVRDGLPFRMFVAGAA